VPDKKGAEELTSSPSQRARLSLAVILAVYGVFAIILLEYWSWSLDV